MSTHRTRAALALGLGLAAGVAAGRLGALGATLTHAMIYGRRQPLWRHPSELGLRAEPVAFAAEDGVGLRGWLLRADVGGPAPAALIVHGWPWSRCGNRAGQLPIEDADVDLLAVAAGLRASGRHVLLFDLRNHGQSDAAPPVTFGLREARDVSAAVRMLRARPDVDPRRITPIGYSMGANSVLYALADIQPIPAAVLVQPVRAGVFARRLAAAALGPAGPALLGLSEGLYRAAGGPPLDAIDPSGAAAAARDTALLFVQGDGDPWGPPEEVRAMAAAAPRGRLALAPSADRYGGYQWVGQHLDEVLQFLDQPGGPGEEG